MLTKPNSLQLLPHTHAGCIQTNTEDALSTIGFIAQQSILSIIIDNQTHNITKTILKNPQDLFMWGSINTRNNLKGKQIPRYSASQLTLNGHQQTPVITDLHHYKYWVLLDAEAQVTAQVTIGAQTHNLTAEQSILLPPMHHCQLTNLKSTPLTFIQVQSRDGFNPKQNVQFEFNH